MRRWRRLAPLVATAAPAGCGPQPQAECRVSAPNGSLPPGEQMASADYLGNGKLWTVLWPDGQVVFEPGGTGEIRPDGSLAMKFPFWRGEGVVGDLLIYSERLDGDGSPVAGEIPEGYGDGGFQAAALVFPSAGCWPVTAGVGDEAPTFTTQVVLAAMGDEGLIGR